MTCWPEGGPGLEPGTDMFGIAGTAELSTFCPGTGTWNRLQDGIFSTPEESFRSEAWPDTVSSPNFSKTSGSSFNSSASISCPGFSLGVAGVDVVAMRRRYQLEIILNPLSWQIRTGNVPLSVGTYRRMRCYHESKAGRAWASSRSSTLARAGTVAHSTNVS